MSVWVLAEREGHVMVIGQKGSSLDEVRRWAADLGDDDWPEGYELVALAPSGMWLYSADHWVRLGDDDSLMWLPQEAPCSGP